MFKHKPQVRSLLTVATPVLAVTVTYLCLPQRTMPNVVMKEPRQAEPRTPRVNKDTLQLVISKQTIMEELLDGYIDVARAFDEFRQILKDNEYVHSIMYVWYGSRSLEEIAALNVVRYLENSPLDPRAVELLPEARCEFECRFGPQVWILGDYGICPYPVK